MRQFGSIDVDSFPVDDDASVDGAEDLSVETHGLCIPMSWGRQIPCPLGFSALGESIALVSLLDWVAMVR